MNELSSGGCFATIPRQGNTKRRKVVNIFDVIDSQPWYQDQEEVTDLLVCQIEELRTDLHRDFVNSIVHYIDKYEFSREFLPAIALFTGVSLPDQESVFSTIKQRIRNNKKTKCHLVDLKPNKATTLRSLITSMVSDIYNNKDIDDDESFLDDEDDETHVVKSKCTMMGLTEWYFNNYGSLDDTTASSDDFNKAYIVVTIRDIGSFPDEILNEFLSTLNCYKNTLPFMLVFGVPTSLGSLHAILDSDILPKLSIYPFQYQPSVTFLDKVLDKIFLTEDSVFYMDANVFQVLCNLFIHYNNSVEEFIKAIKLCVAEHFSDSPCTAFRLNAKDIAERIDDLDDETIDNMLKLPSMVKYNQKRKMEKLGVLKVSSPDIKQVLQKLHQDFHTSIMQFNVAVRCIYILLKSLKSDQSSISLREIFINVMNRDKRSEWLEKNLTYFEYSSKDTILDVLIEMEDLLKNHKKFGLSDPLSTISKFLKGIENSKLEAVKRSPRSPMKSFCSPSNRKELLESLKQNATKEKALSEFDILKKQVMNYIQRDFLRESLRCLDDIALRELYIYNNHQVIHRLLDGIPRTAINTALETPSIPLECTCCKQKSQDQIIETMPDISILYKLQSECGNHINLHDWFQQFRTIVDKKDFKNEDIDADIYKRFVLAFHELQHIGFISLPKKKTNNEADYVTKLSF